LILLWIKYITMYWLLRWLLKMLSNRKVCSEQQSEQTCCWEESHHKDLPTWQAPAMGWSWLDSPEYRQQFFQMLKMNFKCLWIILLVKNIFIKGSCLSTLLLVYLPLCLFLYLCICVSVYLCICLSVNLSICLSVYLSICLSIYLSIFLSVYLSICLYVYLSICLSLYHSIYLFIWQCVDLSIYLSLYHSIYLFIWQCVYLSQCLIAFLFLIYVLIVRPVMLSFCNPEWL